MFNKIARSIAVLIVTVFALSAAPANAEPPKVKPVKVYVTVNDYCGWKQDKVTARAANSFVKVRVVHRTTILWYVEATVRVKGFGFRSDLVEVVEGDPTRLYTGTGDYVTTGRKRWQFVTKTSRVPGCVPAPTPVEVSSETP